MDSTRKDARLRRAQSRERYAQFVAVFLAGMVTALLIAVAGSRSGGRGQRR
ncbi:hypothetical protein GCM10009527_014320 [Actinomadura nitritigenes]